MTVHGVDDYSNPWRHFCGLLARREDAGESVGEYARGRIEYLYLNGESSSLRQRAYTMIT